MKKMVVLLGLSILLLVLPNTFALICTDSDKGPLNIKEPLPYAATIGTTKDSNTTKTDTCIDKKNGLPSSKGMWLREFYCEDNKVKSTEYMCLSLNYDECNKGRCAKFGEKIETTQKQKSKRVPWICLIAISLVLLPCNHFMSGIFIMGKEMEW